MMKIYKVTFNDGGWHESLPEYTVVDDSEDNAIKQARSEHTYLKDWEACATEFKISGYIIEVYDEKTYNRDKNLEKLDI